MDLSLLDLITYFALVFTVGSFLAGVEVCLKIWNKRSTSDVPVLPLLTGFFCTALWFKYGLYANDTFMIFVNAVGVLSFLSYVIFYYYFCPNKRALNKKLGICTLLFTFLHLLSKTQDDPKHFAGLSASTASVFFTASPLAATWEVIETKSSEKMPFLLILSSFLVTSLWYIYGVLVHDTFVQVPNGIGALVSAAQLVLFFMFRSGSRKQGLHSRFSKSCLLLKEVNI